MTLLPPKPTSPSGPVATQPAAIMACVKRYLEDAAIAEPDLRARVLSLHLHFHKAAVKILDNRRPEELGGDELRRLFRVGTLAAFTAIQLFGWPLRIGNALSLTLSGPDPQVLMPDRAQDMLRVAISGRVVKNREPIDFRLRRDQTRALEIVEWYVRVIRPLSPGAITSTRLFVGPRGPKLFGAVLGVWFSDAMRALGIAMTCHSFASEARSQRQPERPAVTLLCA